MLSLQYATRSTTGPVKLLFLFFAVFHTELLAHNQEYDT